MNDKPTPETDEMHRMNCLPSIPEQLAYQCVMNLSRRLERERDEWIELSEKLKAEISNVYKRQEETSRLVFDLLIERDKAIEELAAWKEARK